MIDTKLKQKATSSVRTKVCTDIYSRLPFLKMVLHSKFFDIYILTKVSLLEFKEPHINSQ